MGLTSSAVSASASGGPTIEYVSATVPCNNSFELPRNFCGIAVNSAQCGEILLNGSYLSCTHATAGFGGVSSPIVIAKGASLCSKQGTGSVSGYYFD